MTCALEIGRWIASLDARAIPANVSRACTDTVIDTLGLSVAARNTDYIAALEQSWATPGRCRIFGSNAVADAPTAAMINGTAAHGEDFDNTFEGCPNPLGRGHRPVDRSDSGSREQDCR